MSAFDIVSRTMTRLGIPSSKLGNVVVVPGILGSDLADENDQHLWLFPPRLDKLSLAPDGSSESDFSRIVHATNLNIIYAPLVLALEASWNVLTFAYDWRMNIPDMARLLAETARNQFSNKGFHIVAHSMGGLIARIMLRDNPEIQGDGKLIMLGTPNHGSWLAVSALTTDLGATAFFRSIVGITVPPTTALTTARTWPSSYQFLPCPQRDPKVRQVYDNPLPGLSAKHLGAAAQLHAELDAIPAADSMVYIAGSNVPTNDGDTLPTLDGDGVVSHRLGRLDGIQLFKVLGDHVSLPSNLAVLTSITPLLLGRSVELLIPF